MLKLRRNNFNKLLLGTIFAVLLGLNLLSGVAYDYFYAAGRIVGEEFQCYNSSGIRTPGTSETYYHRTKMMPSYGASFGTGRLGNQMSTFASIYAYERMYGIKGFVTAVQAEVLEAYFNFQDLKNAPMRVLESHVPEWKMVCWENPFERTDKKLKEYDLSSNATWQRVKRGRFIDMGPYINDVYAYAPYLKDLRKAFAFKPSHEAYARERLNIALTMFRGAHKLESTASVIVISVHVRRQDYALHMDALYKGKGLANADYFGRAIDYFRKHRFPDKPHLFAVVSDDMNWCKEKFASIPDLYFVGTPNDQLTSLDRSNALRQGEDIGNDLALLAHANHSILSHGTYGMWGALLAGGETVLPGYYKKVKESREIDKAKLPGWVFL